MLLIYHTESLGRRRPGQNGTTYVSTNAHRIHALALMNIFRDWLCNQNRLPCQRSKVWRCVECLSTHTLCIGAVEANMVMKLKIEDGHTRNRPAIRNIDWVFILCHLLLCYFHIQTLGAKVSNYATRIFSRAYGRHWGLTPIVTKNRI